MMTSKVTLVVRKNMGEGDKGVYLGAILLQIIYASNFFISKAAFDVGMNTYVFTFYRQIIGALFLFPFAFIFERKKAPSITCTMLADIFLLSLIGITLSLNLSAIGLANTSATLGAALNNSIPVTTFLVALLFRAEEMNLRTVTGIAKVVGLILCMGGVLTLALYKGPLFKPFLHGRLFDFHHHLALPIPQKAWIKGCSLIFISNLVWSLGLVFQAKIVKDYPSTLMFTCIQMLSSSIQAFGIAIALEKRPSQWKLGWNFKLVAVTYCGIIVTGVGYYLRSWILQKQGPVFQAVTTPLGFIFATLCSLFLLGQAISLGSVLGGILSAASLCSVLWAKSKEQMRARSMHLAVNESDHEMGSRGKALDQAEAFKNASPDQTPSSGSR